MVVYPRFWDLQHVREVLYGQKPEVVQLRLVSVFSIAFQGIMSTVAASFSCVIATACEETKREETSEVKSTARCLSKVIWFASVCCGQRLYLGSWPRLV